MKFSTFADRTLRVVAVMTAIPFVFVVLIVGIMANDAGNATGERMSMWIMSGGGLVVFAFQYQTHPGYGLPAPMAGAAVRPGKVTRLRLRDRGLGVGCKLRLHGNPTGDPSEFDCEGGRWRVSRV